ncbi:MAG: TusE/DsrC/DsvC family sulfur relay protein [Actinomycetota bacterium]|nr:TusE/DsrC/DsvC family sulfur relay protein [Actinomycetota bacterium]
MSDDVNKGMPVDLDEEGYLIDYHQWDEAIAHALAEKEGVGELTPDRMEIIKFMRTYYEKYNYYPILRHVCKNVHQEKECINEEFIDPLKAVKIAGLPQPTGEVVAYLKDEVA